MNRNGLKYTNVTRNIYLKRSITMYENIPEIMTLRECRDILRIGKNTMLELLHEGRIEGFKVGNRWKIPKESLVEFIKFG